MMFRFLVIICSVLFLLSCNPTPVEQKVPVKKTVVKKKSVKKVTKKKTKSGYINNDNVTEVLKEYASKHKESIISIKTKHGTIKVRLFRDVVMHSANFLLLAKDGYFDGTSFYRVVPGLVVQGGDTDSREKTAWKRKIGSYKIPPEVKAKYIHKKGALAMSRSYTNNPKKLSSSWDFYIVHGEALTPGQLSRVPEQHRAAYEKLGGTPHLDGEHTVFGEVIEGLSVVNKITTLEVDRGDWPLDDVTMKMKVLR